MQVEESVKILVTVKEQIMTLDPCTVEVYPKTKVEFVFEGGGSGTVVFIEGSPFKEEKFEIGHGKERVLQEVMKEEEKSFAYFVTSNPKAGGTIIIRPRR